MKSKTFRHLACIGIAVLAAGAICSDAGANGKHLVTKNLKIRGTIYADLTGWTSAGVIGFTVTEVNGMMSHAGQYDLDAKGELDFNTLKGFDTGTFFAANGDKIFFRGDITINPDMQTGTLIVSSLENDPPGSGRFAEGGGWFESDISNIILNLDPPTGTGTMSFEFEGSGYIAY